jgi:BirA family biotin operon repressor/biotin-[acetyl-CoA-carboxylase] ligase
MEQGSMAHDDIAESLRILGRRNFLRRIDWFDELPSTNTFAQSAAERLDGPLPWLVGTDRQTAGRGRGQNAWWSSDGALTFSTVIAPSEHGLEARRLPQVALISGLAVADALEDFLPPASVQLKWPNDVFAGGRKICGILSEVPPLRTDRLVIGIGVNVANSLASENVAEFVRIPTDAEFHESRSALRETAVALCDLRERDCPTRGEVLIRLIECWEQWLQRLAAGEIDFPEIWRSKCLLQGERISVALGSDVQTGVCLGLDVEGALLLQTDRGTQRILAGTVRRLD